MPLRIRFMSFQPTCITDIDRLADDLNKTLSTPGELRCGEYSFKLRMNPWQHPMFDENIHYLLSLLKSLCRGCGGVVYFVVDDIQTVPQEIFQIYKERLHELIGRNLESFPLHANMVRVCSLLGTHRSWAAFLLKRSYGTLTYPQVETKRSWKPIPFHMDVFGKMHTKSMPNTQSQTRKMARTSISPDQRTGRSALPAIYSQDNSSRQTKAETPSAFATAPPMTVSDDSANTAIPEVDFSSCQRLDWTETMKDWQKYVKIKEVKTDDIVGQCPLWKPTHPMKITPDRHSLRYLFNSEKNLDETLSAVTTMDPGCAVVCRTWRFHISDGFIAEELPTGSMCDILTVTDAGRLCLWVVVDSLNEDNFDSQMEYLMTTGRMLKYQIVQKGEGDDLSNLWIDCRLLPLHTSYSIQKAVRMRLSESQEIQGHLYNIYQDGVAFGLLQRALTKLILSKESPLKRCIGDHTSITLSAQQAEVLMHKAKVNYITGPAGSGKSYTGCPLYKMYGKERSVYICTTNEFLQYLKFNGCTGTLVLGDQDLLREIKSGTFESKVCVVIDDCHKFRCTRKSMKKLFKVLNKHKHMSLFVFADNDYQSFDRKRQQAVHECILDLSRTVLKEFPVNFPLTDIYRNTRKIVSFVQAAIQDVDDGHQKIESANIENGEGVECIAMSNLWEDKPDNDLVLYLHSLLLSENYSQSDVAILLESGYTTSEIQQCKQIVAKYISTITVQSADVFPRAGVIVDSVDSFLGLEASVCIFLLSHTWKNPVPYPRPRKIFQRRQVQLECEMNIYNPRYEVFLASRATHKAVFVVPELHEDLVHQMKFEDFQVCV